MSIEVKIPAVGESITSGVLSAWHKNNGDVVSDGEALFTLETDKISTEVPAVGSGKLQIQVDAGQEVKIGQVVGLLEENVKAAKGTNQPSSTETADSAGSAPKAVATQPGSRRLSLPLVKPFRPISRKGMKRYRPPHEESPRKNRSSCRMSPALASTDRSQRRT